MGSIFIIALPICIAGIQDESVMIMSAIGFPLNFISVAFLIADRRVRKLINEWQKDAVKLTAKAKSRSIVSVRFNKGSKLHVRFVYNNKTIERLSGTKITNGFDTLYPTLDNKNITILYSPKHDEVMILKD